MGERHRAYPLMLRALTLAMVLALVPGGETAASESREAMAAMQMPTGAWRVAAGAGLGVFPDYSGASTYRRLPLPYVDVVWGDRVRINPVQGLQVDVLPGRRWRGGPVIRYLGGRSARGAISDLDSVRGGAAAGGYLRYAMGPIQLSAEAVSPLTGDISGTRVTLGANWRGRLGSQGFYTLGPSAVWDSSNRADGLYGLSQAEADTLAVAPHEARSGIASLRITGTVVWMLDEHWSLTGFASAGRLVGDAADSPIVAELGNRNQGLLGLFALYRF
ncbi:MAG: MipA/OmpV family protein [Ectothiorhodospiraceae bacterium]|nr:MipA/OmpV family protein [Ectothiorhodospiraceae bacterium]